MTRDTHAMVSVRQRTLRIVPRVAFAFVVSLVLFFPAVAAQEDLVQHVNTLRGSNSRPEYSRGNTFPAVTVPFGFNFWTPITEGNSSSWLYRYDRTTIQGFGVSHQPSPWVGDHGSIQIMPQLDSVRVAPAARAATFEHGRESASPDYYSVELGSPSIRTEITPTDHASRFRFTFPDREHAYLLFDSIDSVTGAITVASERRMVEGHVDHNGPRLYFAAKSEQAFERVEDLEQAGVSAAVRFAAEGGLVVDLSMATSFISVEQARANLMSEVGARSFEDVRSEASRAWNGTLRLIEVKGASAPQKVTLYSSLYRAFMYPNSMWERVGGNAAYFSPYDGEVHAGKIWVNNGFWDTYRAAWPLYTLLLPEQTAEMLDGFVRAYHEGGWTPRWSGPGYLDVMVGSHADSIFADAYLKGVQSFDVQSAYASMLKNALVASDHGALGRKGNEVSIFKGYVPTSTYESAAWSLENYVNDFGIARLAAALGDSLHAEYFRGRALRYSELFSHEVGFFRGRKPDGSWRTSAADFNPREWGYEFTEGNAWHYCVAANHDPEGMAALYGSRAALSTKIDEVLSADRQFLRGSYPSVIHEMVEAYDTNMGQYAHANQPTHHMLYMYNYAGTPWKTQQHVREVLDEARGIYGPGLGDGGGYLGDEDNGQMSAWFVFSALGLYPASPAHPEYAIGSPLFTRATLNLSEGKRFVVSAPNNSDANRYVQSARLNGQPLNRSFVTHDELSAGGELTLEMGPSASKWGSGRDDVPSSFALGSRPRERLRDRTAGGFITASDEHADHGAALAFDDDSRTIWRATSAAPWISTRLPGAESYAVGHYTVTSGRGPATTDPVSWALQASLDGADWLTVDARSGQSFEWRQQTRVFAVARPSRASHYRLVIEANGGGAETEVAELELLWGQEATPHDGTRDVAPTAFAEPSAAARRGSDDDAGAVVEPHAGSDVSRPAAEKGHARQLSASRTRDSGCGTIPGVPMSFGPFGALSLLILAFARRRRA
jgi:predicted alpha-1,2-mannosidase